MSINLIVANAENGTIGKMSSIPWNISEDLKRFRKITNGSIVIMGRKTYESIGKPLVNRYNFVISKTGFAAKGTFSFVSIEESLAFAKRRLPQYEIFVIGGASIYEYFLKNNLIDKIYQTIIHQNYYGDVIFSFDKSDWKLVKEIKGDKFSYLTWLKIDN